METIVVKKTEDNEKKRVMFIDIAKGISIILMIIGHTIGQGTLRSVIFSFHLPLFIITSGFFYKEKSIKEDVKELIIKLLIPTIIVVFFVFMINNIYTKGFFYAFIESIKVIIVGWSYKAKINYSFEGVNVVWFVYLLIVIRLLFRINKKIAKDDNVFLLILIILEMYVGYILGIKGYWLPWSLDVALFCVFFYYIGYILKQYSLLEKFLSNYKSISEKSTKSTGEISFNINTDISEAKEITDILNKSKLNYNLCRIPNEEKSYIDSCSLLFNMLLYPSCFTTVIVLVK